VRIIKKFWGCVDSVIRGFFVGEIWYLERFVGKSVVRFLRCECGGGVR
jgi:hypothetical protein